MNSKISSHDEQMWLIATQALFSEFSFQIDEIQFKDQIKQLFIFYSEHAELSKSASISLYYRLFLFVALMLVQILEEEGVAVKDFSFNDIAPIYDSSLEWSSLAIDNVLLEEMLENINQSLEVLIYDCQNREI